ncbi:hypothetical protein [Methylobacterium isbiliense]|uniref:Uncharacterized protein n=1 Tax=Methylobacterium isbiliense TaxID=315478 RepID=A0ABQ4SNC6_9HYPH|nr:hypothetical protein [Methylobacterium isbiliense]MDN3625346.1 hypothetical protein [Methylobacterium isbiliense]GJE03186.1 hypothetical protein GMJLKIPL_5137 [Methylobacterium isbiliense]
MRRDLIGLGLGALALCTVPAAAGPVGAPQAGAPHGGFRPAPARGAVAGYPRGPHHPGHRAGFRRHSGYGYGYGLPLGYAGVVAGAPAAAAPVEPFLTLPSPEELVPAAWGYGTYGIPTVAGIPAPPRADPVVYVIHGVESERAAPPARRIGRDPAGSGRRSDTARPAEGIRPVSYRAGAARVVELTVPRR